MNKMTDNESTGANLKQGLRVSVDQEICQGNGVCERRAPEVFSLGDDDRASVLEAGPTMDHLDDVRAAARSCPTQAITFDVG